jgi:hypothetical protein
VAGTILPDPAKQMPSAYYNIGTRREKIIRFLGICGEGDFPTALVSGPATL